MELIDIKDLLIKPENVNPKVSPLGDKIAYINNYENNISIIIMDLKNRKENKELKIEKSIKDFLWSYDNRNLICIQDDDGDEIFKIYRFDVDENKYELLTPLRSSCHILKYNEEFPDQLLFTMNQENTFINDVYILDLKTKNIRLVCKNPGYITDWIGDNSLNIRAAYIDNEDGGLDLALIDHKGNITKRLFKWGTEDIFSSDFVDFTRDNKQMYVKDSHRSNTGVLVKVNLENEISEIIAEDKDTDVHEVLINQDNYEVDAVSFYKERKNWIVINKELEIDFKIILSIDSGDLNIVSRNQKSNVWVISFNKDNASTTFYIYNSVSKEYKFLFYDRPNLVNYKLSSMKPISFVARDGLIVKGYLTCPKNKLDKKLPLIVKVHGGPQARDYCEYDAVTQWLVNRGYACLKINYRGSIGYGKNFIKAGYKEWGGKMQDDVIDGVYWAIENGIADKNRIALYGGSYGGYVALMGAAFKSNLFKCVVDINGPSSLITFLETMPPFWIRYKEIFYRRIGDLEKEKDFLKSRSPVYFVDNIKIPVFIAQGAKDPRVKRHESEQIVEKLKANGVEYNYLLFDDEGHGIKKNRNRIKLYKAIEEFLNKNLKMK